MTPDDIRKVLKIVDRWWGMHRRINNSKYYGKGSETHTKISVCSEWHGTEGRQAFVEWSLKNGFDFYLVLDRIRNEEGYSPNNCQWITSKENTAKELRKTEYKGKFYTKKELSKLAHPSVTEYAFKARLLQGWSIEEALTLPSNHGNSWKRGSRN